MLVGVLEEAVVALGFALCWSTGEIVSGGVCDVLPSVVNKVGLDEWDSICLWEGMVKRVGSCIHTSVISTGRKGKCLASKCVYSAGQELLAGAR